MELSMPFFRLTNIISGLVVNIPPKFIMGIGNMLGTFMFCINIPHRRITRRNLKFAYPDWTYKQVKKRSKDVFQNIATTVLELGQMYFFSREDMLNKAEYSGVENFVRAYKHNRGVIIVSAHMGNWEMIPMISPHIFKKTISYINIMLKSNHFARRTYNRERSEPIRQLH